MAKKPCARGSLISSSCSSAYTCGATVASQLEETALRTGILSLVTVPHPHCCSTGGDSRRGALGPNCTPLHTDVYLALGHNLGMLFISSGFFFCVCGKIHKT